MIGALQLLAYLACLIGSGFVSGIETGVISIHPVRLMHRVREGVKGAAVLQRFVDDTDRLLGTTLVGATLGNVVAAVISTSFSAKNFGPLGESVVAVATALLVLVFAEYLPKAWFHSRPMVRSLRYVRALRILEIMLWPLAVVCIAICKVLIPGKVTFGRPGLFATKEDLKHLADEGAAHGTLSHRERSMINRVFELSGKSATQVMVPRHEMVHARSDAKLEEFFDVARATGFTRMPVFDESRNAFVGIVNVFDVLSQQEEHPDEPLLWFARTPFFVSPNTPVDDILPLMRRNRQPLCLVRDDAGEVLGMLTTEDILEEIVGAL